MNRSPFDTYRSSCRHLGEELLYLPLDGLFLLPAARIKALMKVASAVKKRDGHHGYLKVGGGADGISGQHAETTAIGGNAGFEGDFHGEIGDSTVPVQRTQDGGGKARKALFEDVVRGPLLDDGGRRLVTNGAGNHNERNIQALLLQQLQSSGSAELRQGVVGQDHFRRLLQESKIGRFRIGALPQRIEAAAAQLVNHQFSIVRAVLDNQEAQGLFRG